MNPLVSVCITTFNRKELLPLTVRSVLEQTYKNIEVIIVDDHSTDGTQKLIEDDILKYDDRVRYIRHDINKGLAFGRNSAICNAKGKYFTFCDDDDRWPTNFISQLITALVGAPIGVDVALGFKECCSKCHVFFDSYPTMRELILAGVTPPVAAQMYRTNILKTFGGYDPRIRSGVDHDLWISLAAICDPRVTVAWDVSPLVGNNVAVERMTTNEQRRRTGIATSLEVWEPKIVSTFGVDFYKHFCRCYFDYLDIKFFTHELRRKAYVRATARILSPSVAWWIIGRLFWGAKRKRACGLFPPYRYR